MKNITLTKDEVYSLVNLINEIDYEESNSGEYEDFECNTDLVIENLYKIKDIIAIAIAR